MKRIRVIVGIAALVVLTVGLNFLVLNQNFFSWTVLGITGAGVLLGVAWVVLTLAQVAGSSAREGRSLYGLNTVVTSILALGICVVLYAFAAHRELSWDLTEEGRRQLSEQTVQVLRNLDTDVNVVAFFLQIDDELVQIAREKTERFLDQCKQYTPHLKVEFLDPQIDRVRLEGLKITHASTQGTIVIQCGTRQKVITLIGASPRLEERDFTNGLINVVRDAQPKVCFLTGHGERNTDDTNEKSGGSALKQLLEGESYTVDRTAIMITRPEVPADCDILVINGMGLTGPQADLHPEEIKAIQAFLDRGGRLLVLLDPWRKSVTSATQTEQLLPWLRQKYGVAVGDDIVVSPTSKWAAEFSPDTSLFPVTQGAKDFHGSYNQTHRITQGSDQKMLFSAGRSVGLANPMPAGVVGVPLLRTTPDFYGETDLATLLSEGKAIKSAEEVSGPLPMAVAITAKTDFVVGDSGQTRDARIVVVGDSDFVSNAQLTIIPGNLNFILNAVAWLSENEELIAIRPTGKQDSPVMLSERGRRVVVYVAVLGTLQAVVAAGLIVYWLRRKYR